MLSLLVIPQSLHINEIHKYSNSFLIIPNLSSKCYNTAQNINLSDGGRKIDPTDSCCWTLLKCKTFSSTNKIVWNVYRDEMLNLL